MTTNFYKTGGTLAAGAACYVMRYADEELFNHLCAGEYCYVLDCRQVGKSSLIAHTKSRLEKAGISVAVVELTALGFSNVTPEQWYEGLLAKIGAQLHWPDLPDFEDQLDDYWINHQQQAPLRRFLDAIGNVVMERIKGRIAIFFDEIDVVHSLPFSTDELFAGIRELYNRRTEDANLSRLSFGLIGVAQPTNLIQDPRITPFNIGRRIELTDFTAAEAGPLAQGLPGGQKQKKRILERILYWTGGHPYLTQQLCRAVVEETKASNQKGVDRVCKSLFFTLRARNQEHNLKFVSNHLLCAPESDSAKLLDLYAQVSTRRGLRDDPANLLLGVLRLSGIVRSIDGYLRIRNRIYARVFDRAWISENLPDAEKRRQQKAYRRGLKRMGLIAGVVVVSLAAAGASIWDRYFRLQEDYFITYVKGQNDVQGIGLLSKEEVANRRISYKLIRHGKSNPVVAIEAVDSTGKCTPHNDVGTFLNLSITQREGKQNKECRWEFVRDYRDQLVYEKAFCKNGKLVWGLVYSPQIKGKPRSAHYVGPDGFPARTKSTAEIVEIEYTPEGWEKQIRYFDRQHRPQPGMERRVFGERKEYDQHGLVNKIISLNANGKSMADRYGIVSVNILHDVQGNPVEILFFGIDGQPVLKKDGYHQLTTSYDERGNPVEISFFGIDGQPVLKKGGYHQLATNYDERGNPVVISFFGIDGQPVLQKDGYHQLTASYDERGNLVETLFFGIDGQPVLQKDGYHQRTAEYDEQGNQIKTQVETTVFGPGGQPF